MTKSTEHRSAPECSQPPSSTADPIFHSLRDNVIRFYSHFSFDGLGHNFRTTHLDIDFRRTVRVADNADISDLPPGFDSFPLYEAAEYPNAPFPRRDYFMPMYQREAMWIHFQSRHPFAIKVFIGGVNAISGEHEKEDKATDLRRFRNYKEGKCIQDYVVSPDQPWLDGVADQDGTVRQFVAMPLGTGYSVEKQITGEEVKGGIQIQVTPARTESPGVFKWVPRFDPSCITVYVRTPDKTVILSASLDQPTYALAFLLQEKEGTPFEQQKLFWGSKQLELHKTLREHNVYENCTIYMFQKLYGGGCGPDDPDYAAEEESMGIAAGGRIKQSIVRDTTEPHTWDGARFTTVRIHVVNSESFKRIVGKNPPISPITSKTYKKLGLPYFNIYHEKKSGIKGNFNGVKSVNQFDKEAVQEVDESEAHHIVDLNERGERPPFRHVKELENKMRMLRISGFSGQQGEWLDGEDVKMSG